MQEIYHNIKELKEYLKDKKIFLVNGNIRRYKEIYNFFNDLNYIEFTNILPNPTYEKAVEGVRCFNESKADIILAIGGGSVIDVSKCIKLFSTLNPSINYLKQEYKTNKIPLIVLPTTAGSGSEATKHAVIYYEGIKQSISHESILPKSVILDPSVLKTLPIYQKKATLLDGLCQAIESYWSKKSNEESKTYSKEAIELIMNNYKAYLNDYNEEVAYKMLLAANLAGKAINITTTTAAHAMSYKLASMYNLAHGHAVGLCMKEVFKYNNEQMTLKLPITLNQYLNIFDDMNLAYPSTTKLKEDLTILTDSVNSLRLSNNPVNIDSNQINKLYKNILTFKC